jgi:hypothetical protein
VEYRHLKPTNSQSIELTTVIQTKEGTRKIFSIKLVEWRYVLVNGAVAFDVELAPYSHRGVGKMETAGVLSLKLQLYPFSKLSMVQPTAIDRELQLEMKNK